MKILHHLGHNHNWSLEAFTDNQIGDGFLLSAYSISKEKIGQTLSGKFKAESYMPLSMLDLQYYGSKESNGGELNTYEFHPINYSGSDVTEISTVDAAMEGVRFQIEKGFNNIIIPNVSVESKRLQRSLDLIKGINSKLSKNKVSGVSYYLSIPISGGFIREENEVEKLLQQLTDMDVVFDGYYLACESNMETRKKISVDYNYYTNLNKIIATLKRQGFKVILGFANVEALVFAALNDIDYITIGTYENLRNFNIKRFTEEGKGGGPSDGWYYSEKILNFVKAKQLEMLYERNALDLIRNEENIFSDIILKQGYPWNTHRPDVHKNYLLAISRQLQQVASRPSKKDRIAAVQEMIESAKTNYNALDDKGIVLDDASSNYHLAFWQSILKTPELGVISK